MNGSLPGHEGIAIPLRDLPDGDDIWGASVQRVLDQIRTYRVRGATVFQITDWTWQAQSFDPEVVKQIIAWLTTAMTHKGMVFGGADLEPFLDWHMGFGQGVAMAGVQLELAPEGVWWALAQQRGWHVLATLPWREMREHGMSDDAIIDEILTIDILAWRHAYLFEDTDQAIS
ncbi:MAG: hypothetical protein H0T53_15040 [Herpetosiphonaceae bacterium]|nr:hypothetical protein [Herpetosiphonaceae bacterium]